MYKLEPGSKTRTTVTVRWPKWIHVRAITQEDSDFQKNGEREWTGAVWVCGKKVVDLTSLSESSLRTRLKREVDKAVEQVRNKDEVLAATHVQIEKHRALGYVLEKPEGFDEARLPVSYERAAP